MVTPFRTELDTACTDADPEAFFDDAQVAEATSFCDRCPARTECLTYALDNEQYGVWGGLTAKQRSDRKGGALQNSPEERQVVWAIHQRVARGDLMPDIAGDLGVNQRTLYRWLAEAKAEAA